tara:strand:- start:4226 stop:6517 length:2292 start_codon:yes stop_codon:yes gene_type:complete
MFKASFKKPLYKLKKQYGRGIYLVEDEETKNDIDVLQCPLSEREFFTHIDPNDPNSDFEVMDPVIAEDGWTYSHEELQKLFDFHGDSTTVPSPKTNNPMGKMVIPNNHVLELQRRIIRQDIRQEIKLNKDEVHNAITEAKRAHLEDSLSAEPKDDVDDEGFDDDEAKTYDELGAVTIESPVIVNPETPDVESAAVDDVELATVEDVESLSEKKTREKREKKARKRASQKARKVAKQEEDDALDAAYKENMTLLERDKGSYDKNTVPVSNRNFTVHIDSDFIKDNVFRIGSVLDSYCTIDEFRKIFHKTVKTYTKEDSEAEAKKRVRLDKEIAFFFSNKIRDSSYLQIDGELRSGSLADDIRNAYYDNDLNISVSEKIVHDLKIRNAYKEQYLKEQDWLVPLRDDIKSSSELTRLKLFEISVGMFILNPSGDYRFKTRSDFLALIKEAFCITNGKNPVYWNESDIDNAMYCGSFFTAGFIQAIISLYDIILREKNIQLTEINKKTYLLSCILNIFLVMTTQDYIEDMKKVDINKISNEGIEVLRSKIQEFLKALFNLQVSFINTSKFYSKVDNKYNLKPARRLLDREEYGLFESEYEYAKFKRVEFIYDENYVFRPIKSKNTYVPPLEKNKWYSGTIYQHNVLEPGMALPAMYKIMGDDGFFSLIERIPSNIENPPIRAKGEEAINYDTVNLFYNNFKKNNGRIEIVYELILSQFRETLSITPVKEGEIPDWKQRNWLILTKKIIPKIGDKNMEDYFKDMVDSH